MAFKHLCVLVTCLILASVDGMPRHHSLQKRGWRLCGRQLVDTLAVVCEGAYYDPNHTQRKRNYAYTADSYPSWENSMAEFNGFVDPQTALDFFGIQTPRNPRGVADECCSNSCTIHQLRSYCGLTSRSLEK